MSDFNSSLPVRTETNGDIVSKLCDGTTNTQLLSIDAAGKIFSKLCDTAGTGITSQANGLQQALDVGICVSGVQIDPRSIRALTSSDVVTANQGAPAVIGNAWYVKPTDGTNSQLYTAAGEATVSITQPLPAGTNTIGSVNQGTSPWITKDQSDGPVAPGTVAAFSSLIGGQYNSTLPTLTNGQQAAMQVDASGRLLTSIGNFPTVVDTDYGVVGASTIRVASQIGNATGAADFNAGATGAQTLRVVANQGAPGTAANGWFVRPTDGTNNQSFTAAGEAKVSVTQPLPAGTNLIGDVNSRTQDGAGTAITSGAQGAKQALDVELNSNGAVVDNANPLPVFISNTVPGTEILNYQTHAALAAGASVTLSYTVTALKTLTLQRISVSSSQRIKVEFKIAAVTKAVKFNTEANLNTEYEFSNPQQVAAGVVVAVTITNRGNQPADVYATIEGVEN